MNSLSFLFILCSFHSKRTAYLEKVQMEHISTYHTSSWLPLPLFFFVLLCRRLMESICSSVASNRHHLTALEQQNSRVAYLEKPKKERGQLGSHLLLPSSTYEMMQHTGTPTLQNPIHSSHICMCVLRGSVSRPSGARHMAFLDLLNPSVLSCSLTGDQDLLTLLL